MLLRWIGLFKILERINNVTFTLELLDSNVTFTLKGKWAPWRGKYTRGSKAKKKTMRFYSTQNIVCARVRTL